MFSGTGSTPNLFGQAAKPSTTGPGITVPAGSPFGAPFSPAFPKAFSGFGISGNPPAVSPFNFPKQGAPTSVFGSSPSISVPFPAAASVSSSATPASKAPAAVSTPASPGEVIPDSHRVVSKQYTVIGPHSGLAIRAGELFISPKVGMLAVGDIIESSEECDVSVISGALTMTFSVVKLQDGRGWVSKCSPKSIFLEEPSTVDQWY